MNRILPSRKLRQEAEALLQGWEMSSHPVDAFVRLGARYMLQVALEQKTEEFLGRAHYHRGARRRRGWRNGYEPAKVRTAEGMLDVALPRVRETEVPCHSGLSPVIRQGSDALGRLVTEMNGDVCKRAVYRDVEGMFLEALGNRLSPRAG